MHRYTWTLIQNIQLHIKLAFTLVSRPSKGWVILVFCRYLGIREIWVNWAQISQIMCRDKRKVIQSFQHYISHWMRSNSSAKAIWRLIYTCFRVFGVLGEFWETGSQCPNFSKIVKFYNPVIWSSKFSF